MNMNEKGQGALEYLIIIAAVLAIAAIIVTVLTGVLGGRQEAALVTEAESDATACNQALVNNMEEPGEDVYEDICSDICSEDSDWYQEEVGAVTGDGNTLVTDSDWWDATKEEPQDLVRGACMAGMPEWIVEG